MLEDYADLGGGMDADPMRAGGPSDPWRQGGFGPVKDLNLEDETPCEHCHGAGTDTSGEACIACDGTGSAQNPDPVEAPDEAPPSPENGGPQHPGTVGKYGQRMQWRPEESLAHRLLKRL